MGEPVKMNFRTDNSYDFYLRALVAQAKNPLDHVMNQEELDQLLRLEPPKPGDTWRIRWYLDDSVAGYAICCPKCLLVHEWTTALNCQIDLLNGVCAHARSQEGGHLGSCWQWSGSAEENLLTAYPSLHAIKACGWHGWLKAGVLSGQ